MVNDNDHDGIAEGNLYEGANCLVWSDNTGTASQIMVFAPYYAEEEPEQQTGWVLTAGTAGTADAEWMYYNEDGTQARGWILDGGKWYFLNLETGIMARGFIQVEGKTYYMQQDGSMLTEPRTFTPDDTSFPLCFSFR